MSRDGRHDGMREDLCGGLQLSLLAPRIKWIVREKQAPASHAD